MYGRSVVGKSMLAHEYVGWLWCINFVYFKYVCAFVCTCVLCVCVCVCVCVCMCVCVYNVYCSKKRLC